MRDQTGARIHLGAAAEAEYEFTPMAHGSVLAFGRVRLLFVGDVGRPDLRVALGWTAEAAV